MFTARVYRSELEVPDGSEHPGEPYNTGPVYASWAARRRADRIPGRRTLWERCVTTPAHERTKPWLNRIRIRVAVFVIGIPLAAFGVISLSPAWLMLPLVGVAVASLTMTVNKLTHRLGGHTCLTCGGDLANLAAYEHGVICPACGALNQHRPQMLTLERRDDSAENQEQA